MKTIFTVADNGKKVLVAGLCGTDLMDLLDGGVAIIPPDPSVGLDVMIAVVARDDEGDLQEHMERAGETILAE